jgi:phosphohistidine swiveling domain-containing protein
MTTSSGGLEQATGDATTRLRDGQPVTVDGGAGTVHPHT